MMTMTTMTQTTMMTKMMTITDQIQCQWYQVK